MGFSLGETNVSIVYVFVFYSILFSKVLNWKIFHKAVLLGFSRKEIVPHPEEINYFGVDPPEFPVLPSSPRIFHFFVLTSLEINVLSSIFGVPLEFQRLLLYPHGNFPLISSTGELKFLSGKAHLFQGEINYNYLVKSFGCSRYYHLKSNQTKPTKLLGLSKKRNILKNLKKISLP